MVDTIGFVTDFAASEDNLTTAPFVLGKLTTGGCGSGPVPFQLSPIAVAYLTETAVDVELNDYAVELLEVSLVAEACVPWGLESCSCWFAEVWPDEVCVLVGC